MPLQPVYLYGTKADGEPYFKRFWAVVRLFDDPVYEERRLDIEIRQDIVWGLPPGERTTRALLDGVRQRREEGRDATIANLRSAICSARVLNAEHRRMTREDFNSGICTCGRRRTAAELADEEPERRVRRRVIEDDDVEEEWGQGEGVAE